MDEVETRQSGREIGDDRSVALGIVVELKERRRNELVVLGHVEHGLVGKRHEEHLPVLLGLGAVGREVRVEGRLKVRPPPVGDDLVHGPLVRSGGGPSEALMQQPFQSVHFVFPFVEFPARELEKGVAQLQEQHVDHFVLVH